jgi:hypothetical protein
MSETLHDLGNAINVVLWVVVVIRYARGWRLEWHRREDSQ